MIGRRRGAEAGRALWVWLSVVSFQLSIIHVVSNTTKYESRAGLSRRGTSLRQHYAIADIAGRHKCRQPVQATSWGVVNVGLRFQVVSGTATPRAFEDRATVSRLGTSEQTDGHVRRRRAIYGCTQPYREVAKQRQESVLRPIPCWLSSGYDMVGSRHAVTEMATVPAT
jgi:hypothetical protein